MSNREILNTTFSKYNQNCYIVFLFLSGGKRKKMKETKVMGHVTTPPLFPRNICRRESARVQQGAANRRH